MKALIKLDIFLSKLNDKKEFDLTQKLKKEIFNLMKGKISSLSDYKDDKSKRVVYFIYNPKAEDIICEIIDDKINIVSGHDSLLAKIYLKEKNVEVVFNKADNFLSIFANNEIEISKDYNFKKIKKLINWTDVLNEINENNILNGSNASINESDKFTFKGKSLNELDENSAKDFLDYVFNNKNKNKFVNNLELLESVLLFIKNIDDLHLFIGGLCLNDNDLKGIENLIYFYGNEKDKDSTVDFFEYIEKNYNYIYKNNKNYIEFGYKVRELLPISILENAENPFLNINMKYNLYRLLTQEQKNNIELIKEVGELLVINNDFINVDYEKLSIKEITSLWNTNKSYFLEDTGFIKNLNKNNNFIDFIVELSETTKRFVSSPQTFIEYVFVKLSKKIKSDYRVINTLLDNDFTFDYFGYLPKEYYTEEFVDKVFEKGPFIYLPRLIQLSQTNKEHIVKLLEEDFLEVFPKSWLTPDILFSLSNKAFNSIDFYNIPDFSLEKFTNGSIDIYMKLIERNYDFYKNFPQEIQENEDIFYLFLRKAMMDIHYFSIPNKFKNNTDLALNAISIYPNWGNYISPILWSDGLFLASYLDIMEKMSSENNKEMMYQNLPIEIRRIFETLEIKNNYSSFVLNYVLEKDLESKVESKKTLKI